MKSIIERENPQHVYFMNKHKEVLVSHVAQFANIELEFMNFCYNIKILPAPKLEHKNQTQKIDHKNFYNQELVDMVAEKEKFIIEKYGYAY
jgi:hypothetical protein